MAGAAVLDQSMARKKIGRPATSNRDDVAVKIDRHVVSQCRYVADQRGITLAEYLSEMIRPIAEEDFEKAYRDRNRSR